MTAPIIFVIFLQAPQAKPFLTGKLTPVLSHATFADRISVPADLPVTAGHRSPICPVIRAIYSQGEKAALTARIGFDLMLITCFYSHS